MLHDNRPVYVRLRDVIMAAILDGEYDEGAMLPSVRALAVKQCANPLTVAKAYQSFQDDGIVEVRRGVGMFLAAGARQRLQAMERERFVTVIWPAISEHMQRIGIAPCDLVELARAKDHALIR